MTGPPQPSQAEKRLPPALLTPRRVRGWLALALLVGGLALLRATLVVPVRVDSASMMPTLAPGDIVLVSRTPPAVADLDHGDLVVFRGPGVGGRTLKRVVGLPGDTLVVLDGRLFVDEEPVTEPYVDHALVDGDYSRTFTVPDGSVFVLGDNRGNSIDSRDYGPVSGDELVGRALWRIWPLGGR